MSLHEFGHLLDLKDQDELWQEPRIMYAVRNKGNYKNSLHQDDRDTVKRITRIIFGTSFSSATSTMMVVA